MIKFSIFYDKKLQNAHTHIFHRNYTQCESVLEELYLSFSNQFSCNESIGNMIVYSTYIIAAQHLL